MGLIHHKTLDEQKKVLDHLSSLDNYYDYLTFTELIKIQLRVQFPYAPPNFHSFEKNGSTYWFMHRVFNLAITNNYFTVEGPVHENDYFEALAEYGKLYPVFGNNKHHLLTGQDELIALVRNFADVQSPGVPINKNPCFRYYVSNEQKKILENIKIDLPEGYEIGSMINQFVDHEHRRKGLGQAMEIDLCQKLVRLGHTPYKHVEFFNVDVIKSSNKTTFLTKARSSNGEPDTITYSVINDSTVYGLDDH